LTLVSLHREKMAFFTCVKSSVPILSEDELEEDDLLLLSSSSDTAASSQQSTPQPQHHHQHHLAENLRTSTETVDTLTEDDLLPVVSSSSQNSTPTPHRFSYEVDPELGAFV
jgi:hypothetical protein